MSSANTARVVSVRGGQSLGLVGQSLRSAERRVRGKAAGARGMLIERATR